MDVCMKLDNRILKGVGGCNNILSRSPKYREKKVAKCWNNEFFLILSFKYPYLIELYYFGIM